ncbi:MAG TPA: TIM barrel protein [Vicinamibacteria bacterium]|jgi:hydroxypyruvate isomerase
MALTRRQAILGTGLAGAVALAGRSGADAPPTGRVVTKGRLKQSVSWWCYQRIRAEGRDRPLPEFARAVKEMGLTAIDLLKEDEWPVVRDLGLICSMGYGGGGTIPDGLNNKANHDAIVKGLEKSLPKAAQLGVPNLITFFGNRKGMPDQEGLDNCVIGLNRIKPMAESSGVTVTIEVLNSKVDHKDYLGDRSAYGFQVVKAVGSPKVKVLFDIYHMQIMEGDIIRTVRDNHEWIAHYHTGGVPGRHELDETQELQWRSVCAAIADTGFAGYVAHEFVPTRDPLTSLREAVALCDV